MLSRFALTAALAASVLGLAAPAFAQSFNIPLLTDFEDPAYIAFYDSIVGKLGGELADGKLVIDAGKGAGQGSLATYSLQAGGSTSVSVDVTANLTTPDSDADGNISGAGLIISGNTSPGEMAFYALLLQSDGYLIVAWNNGHISSQLSGDIPPGEDGAPVWLAATETADGVEFSVNDVVVSTLSDSNVNGTEAGLIVFGSGEVTFDNLGLSTNA